MASFIKYAVCLLVVGSAVSGKFAQKSADDGISAVGASKTTQKTPTDQKKSEVAAADSDATVGGAHLWQAPYDTPHMVGDAHDMRYGWVYQVNSEPSNGAEYAYQGVPQDLWHRKLDDHVKSFAPFYYNQDSVAFNEVDSNAGYNSMETMNLAMPKYTDPSMSQTTFKSEAMPDRDMSHLAIIAEARKMSSKPSAEDIRTDITQKTENKDQTTTQLADTTNGKVQMQTIQTMGQKAQAPLLDTAGFTQAVAWTPCGGVAYAPEHVTQTLYPQQNIQSAYTVQQQTPMFQESRTQMPIYEQQQVVQQQQMLASNQQQSSSFEQQHVMQQQQQAIQQSSQFGAKGLQMSSFEKQRVMQQQQPMFQTNEQTSQADQMKSQNTAFDQQNVKQERPMLVPAQQTTFFDQMKSKSPSYDQQVMQQQQSMLSQGQRNSMFDTKGAQIATFEQQGGMQQQPMLAPAEQSMVLGQMSSYQNQQPMLALDKRMPLVDQNRQFLAQDQQIGRFEQAQVGQQPQMFESDQKSMQQQPGMTHQSLQTTQQQVATSATVRQQQQMMNQGQQQSILMAGQEVPAFDHQSTVQQQRGMPTSMDQHLASKQMWAQNFEQRVAIPQQQFYMAGQEMPNADQAQNVQQASTSTNQQSMAVASHQVAANQQDSLAFQQRGGLLAQQHGLQSGYDAGERTLLVPVDQVKLDEMRAALSEAPEVATLHKLKKLHGFHGFHGGVQNLYIAVPTAVYGGYAGGYRSSAYVTPEYSSPTYSSYSTYGPLLLEKNPTSGERLTVVRSADNKEAKPKEKDSESESAKGITAITSLTCPQTSQTSLSTTDEDTMVAAASESYPVDMHGRGCNCNSVEHDDHYHEHVAAVPVEIHPDGRLDSIVESFQIVLHRSKRGVFRSPNYIREINEAVKNVVSLDPVDESDSITIRPRLGRFTPASSPYVEYNPSQYLPIREVDLSGKEHRRVDSPNILSGLVQQTEQSIREAIAKATRSQGQMQVMSEQDSPAASSYATDSNSQPQIISLDEYLKHSQANENLPPIKMDLNQPRPSHSTYPQSYPVHSVATNTPTKTSSPYQPRHLQLWNRPTNLISHPIQVILQSIETRLSSCCESCKTEVLNDIAEKLKLSSGETKEVSAKCKRPKLKEQRKKVEMITSDEDSEGLDDSNEGRGFQDQPRVSPYRKPILRAGDYSSNSNIKRYKGRITDQEVNADDEDEEFEEPPQYKESAKNIQSLSKSKTLIRKVSKNEKHSIKEGPLEDTDRQESGAGDLASLKRMKDLTRLIQKLKNLQNVRESGESNDEEDVSNKKIEKITTGIKKTTSLKTIKSKGKPEKAENKKASKRTKIASYK